MDFISCSMLAVYSTNQEQSDNNGKEERQQQVSTLFPATGKPFLKGEKKKGKEKEVVSGGAAWCYDVAAKMSCDFKLF